MTGTQWFSFAMVAYGVFGLWLAGNRRVAGWWVGLSAQLMWVAFAAITGLWPFYISAAAFGLANARNIARWRRDQRAAHLADAFQRMIDAREANRLIDKPPL